MDVVELSPAYDTNGKSPCILRLMLGEISALAAADVVYDFLALLTMGVKHGDIGGARGRDEL